MRDDNSFKVLGEQNNIFANIEYFETLEEREKSLSQNAGVVKYVDNSTNQIDKKEVATQSDISMSESGSELNPIAQPYVPQMYYIQSPDGIVRVDKDESGRNAGVISGLVESVHALVQVML